MQNLQYKIKGFGVVKKRYCMASVYESLDDFTPFLKDIEKPLDTD